MAFECSKKRRRIVSLNLNDLLASSEDVSVTGKVDELKQHYRAIVAFDIQELMANGADEDMVLLCVVAKIGFVNAVLLKNCINQVPKALLTHRKKYIVSEFSKLSTKPIENVEAYIDLMTSWCPNAICETPKHNMQRYLVPPTTLCLNCTHALSGNHNPVKVTWFGLSGKEDAIKLSLRCRNCKINYSFCQYGNSEQGYCYYDQPRDSIEGSDVVYLDRTLCNLFTSFANHGWTSFSANAEAYNQTFLKSSQEDKILSRKIVSEAFWNQHMEEELRERSQINTSVFYKDADREKIMKEIESIRRESAYKHDYCSDDCKKRGCGKLWITDGIWKLTFPHCMFPAAMKVGLNVNFPCVCPEEPQSGQAFCERHCTIALKEGIPTQLRSFLDHCKMKYGKECTDVTEEMIDQTLQTCLGNEAEDSIASTAETQGTLQLIKSHPELLETCTVEKIGCNKDTGEKGKLRKWSRGHQFIVRAGGHIDDWQPIYKSESPSQVFIIILKWLMNTTKHKVPEEWKDIVLSYDNMCHLDGLKAAKLPLPLPPPYDQMWSSIQKIIDSLHIKNHKDARCKELYSPNKVKEENPAFNTMAAEQTFVWLSRFKKILAAMNKTHHLFYLHRMVTVRNKYTEYCYKNNRKPLLPTCKHFASEQL